MHKLVNAQPFAIEQVALFVLWESIVIQENLERKKENKDTKQNRTTFLLKERDMFFFWRVRLSLFRC